MPLSLLLSLLLPLLFPLSLEGEGRGEGVPLSLSPFLQPAVRRSQPHARKIAPIFRPSNLVLTISATASSTIAHTPRALAMASREAL